MVLIEELLEEWAKAVNDHGIVITFCSEPMNRWDTNNTCETLIDLVFILELGVASTGSNLMATFSFVITLVPQ